MAAGVLSQGTILRVQTGAGPVYAIVGGVVGIAAPQGVLAEVDVTTLESTAREYIAGLAEQGEVSFTLVLVKGASGNLFEVGQQRMAALNGTSTVQLFQLELPASAGGRIYTTPGFVKQFQVKANTGERMEADVVIRWTGATVIT